jgi:hypothetical protein
MKIMKLRRDSRTIPTPDKRVRIPTQKLGGEEHYLITEQRHYSALLRLRMWNSGMSIRELSDRAVVGRSTVWNHVNGKINWEYTRLSTVQRILGALGIKLKATQARKMRQQRKAS